MLGVDSAYASCLGSECQPVEELTCPCQCIITCGSPQEGFRLVTIMVLQMGWPDMRLPILYTMSWPERVPCSEDTWPRLDFRKCSELTFKEPDHAKYPSMELAYSAGRHVTLLRTWSPSEVSARPLCAPFGATRCCPRGSVCCQSMDSSFRADAEVAQKQGRGTASAAWARVSMLCCAAQGGRHDDGGDERGEREGG